MVQLDKQDFKQMSVQNKTHFQKTTLEYIVLEQGAAIDMSILTRNLQSSFLKSALHTLALL